MEELERVQLPEFITKYINEKIFHSETEGGIISKEIYEEYEGEEYIVCKESDKNSENYGKWMLFPTQIKKGFVLNDGNWEEFAISE
jgi:hypothetical protein